MEKTETERKLEDTSIQMQLALKNIGDYEIFRSCINAYISNARSVTFIMQKESSGNPELQKWYEEQQEYLKVMPLLKFFNSQRVHSIHNGVVSPKKTSAPFWGLHIDGKPVEGEGTVTGHYFEGVEEYMPGESSEVIALCRRYFIGLRRLVHQWKSMKAKIESHST